MVAALREVAAGGVKIVPDIQVGSDAGGVIGGLGALLMRSLAGDSVGEGDDRRPADVDVEVVSGGVDDALLVGGGGDDADVAGSTTAAVPTNEDRPAG